MQVVRQGFHKDSPDFSRLLLFFSSASLGLYLTTQDGIEDLTTAPDYIVFGEQNFSRYLYLKLGLISKIATWSLDIVKYPLKSSYLLIIYMYKYAATYV